jgi:uncharacterized protein (TIGR03643 family)
MKKLKYKDLSEAEIDRVIGMAWEDRTSFDVIKAQFGINESEVIRLMRKNMKRSSFEMWRKRVSGRKTKHLAKAPEEMDRFKSDQQRHRDKTY